MKKMLIIAGVLAVVATPAFAQSFDSYYGGGRWVYQPHPGAHHSRSFNRERANEAYGMVPGGYIGRNSPAATGGGSTGYNELEKEEILNH